MNNGFGSFWLHDVSDTGSPRHRLEGEIEADVAVVGAGMTGLWTAYWYAQFRPQDRIVVLEKERVGYGASGRNGGWLSGKTVGMRKSLIGSGFSPQEALAMERRVFSAIDEVLALFKENQLEIDATKGGWMQIARTDSELARVEKFVEEEITWGHTEEDLRLLSEPESLDRVNVPSAKGAVFSPHGASLHPAKLMYGLAELCEQAGVKIYENTEVTNLAVRKLTTSHGSVNAGVTVLATEGYTPSFAGKKREVLPMLSSMIITEPLADNDLERVGWSQRECLSGAQHMYFYAQKTADARIAIGGRGKPYNWGSAFDKNGELDQRTVAQLSETLRGLFPNVRLNVAHAWCGVLGVTRDWSPFVDFQPESSLLQVGGYAGQGVTASYLAGKIAAELLTGADTELTRSPWVRERPRKWEPEPLRWIGANGVYKLYRQADIAERRVGGSKTSPLATLGNVASGR